VKTEISNYNRNNLKSTESGEYQVLTNLIKGLTQEQNRKLNKILIIGESLIEIYPQIHKISPDSQFFIANKSEKILESFKNYFKKHKNYSTYLLDVSKGVSLHDFIFYNGKFDMVIANKIYSRLSKKKRYLSIKFLYKYYLHQYGILCIINYTQNYKRVKSSLLRNIKPLLEKEFSIKNINGSIQFSFYMSNKKYI